MKWAKRFEKGESGTTAAEGQDFTIKARKSLTDQTLCHATIECRCGNSCVVSRNPEGEHQITDWGRHLKNIHQRKNKTKFLSKYF